MCATLVSSLMVVTPISGMLFPDQNSMGLVKAAVAVRKGFGGRVMQNSVSSMIGDN